MKTQFYKGTHSSKSKCNKVVLILRHDHYNNGTIGTMKIRLNIGSNGYSFLYFIYMYCVCEPAWYSMSKLFNVRRKLGHVQSINVIELSNGDIGRH